MAYFSINDHTDTLEVILRDLIGHCRSCLAASVLRKGLIRVGVEEAVGERKEEGSPSDFTLELKKR